jgi:hypothetical protein
MKLKYIETGIVFLVVVVVALCNGRNFLDFRDNTRNPGTFNPFKLLT